MGFGLLFLSFCVLRGDEGIEGRDVRVSELSAIVVRMVAVVVAAFALPRPL